MYFKVIADHLWEEGDSLPSRVGLETKSKEIVGEILKVRLLDDDRELYYEALADDEALEPLYNWAYRDAGVTILQVRQPNGEWRDEIG